ncbi:DNA cytosine methyltransferase [Ferrimicrobium sp.]|uniref:DNA cytosine methyltransferase n=1 Tax=Ferrimicrobium sp. TaxID=2926050 RepID=UPI002631FAA8|nr:DNA cytosine methyltransferase [Ferrimicrobium sp.]
MKTCVEVCAGAGGQAIGLESAGFEPQALVEIEQRACETLLLNRPEWNVCQADLREFSGTPYSGVDLVAGGVPCPPFSVAGRQLGADDERDLFPSALRIVSEARPQAVMLENVRGLLSSVFDDYREELRMQLAKLGYHTDWRLLIASDFGVPQLRPRVIIVAMRKDLFEHFAWPAVNIHNPASVGDTLYDMMVSRGWRGAAHWRDRADDIAPTIVGGSKKHGGGDLGPTRAKRAWAALGVDGMGIADEAPDPDFVGMPRLTIPMVARLQGFPDNWAFAGKKTPAYRQVGNAFPAPVALAVASQITAALDSAARRRSITVA